MLPTSPAVVLYRITIYPIVYRVGMVSKGANKPGHSGRWRLMMLRPETGRPSTLEAVRRAFGSFATEPQDKSAFKLLWNQLVVAGNNQFFPVIKPLFCTAIAGASGVTRQGAAKVWCILIGDRVPNPLKPLTRFSRARAY